MSIYINKNFYFQYKKKYIYLYKTRFFINRKFNLHIVNFKVCIIILLLVKKYYVV